jgi:tagaturonate epimerase
LINKEKVIEIIDKIQGYKVYPGSIRVKGDKAFLMARATGDKYLFIVGNRQLVDKFEGDIIEKASTDGDYLIKKAFLSFANQRAIGEIFTDLRPITSKNSRSFGTGDRLGMVTAAHIEAFKKKDIFPILAQQSARELDRTKRTWRDVISSAVWGYFEAGVRIPFGSDADHIKETRELKKAADAGFTMFTVDPSDYIEDISDLTRSKITQLYYSVDRLSYYEKRYLDKKIRIKGKTVSIDQDVFIPIVVKYAKTLFRTISLYDFLKNHKKEGFDFEVSMDEIEEPVTPLEHYFISSELKAAGVEFNNLALRYPGRWEKAVDYMGDVKIFEADLKAHYEVSKMFDGYKLSLHSGSEKMSTYPLFSKISEGNFHIKTAGTSYLEAIRVVSEAYPDLFRRIYAVSLESFKTDRDSYHLTTDTSKLTDIDKVGDENLKDYLDIPGSRQILHVAFGTILTDPGLKQRLHDTLFENEGLHYKYVKDNIKKHLSLLV